MPHMAMQHDDDPIQKLRDALGDLSGIEILHNQALLAIYLRPESTKKGLIIPQKALDEDRYQSKVGLLVRKGPQAFIDDGNWFTGVNFKEDDWLVFRMSDGWKVTVNEVLCILIDDVNIKGRVPHPDAIY